MQRLVTASKPSFREAIQALHTPEAAGGIDPVMRLLTEVEDSTSFFSTFTAEDVAWLSRECPDSLYDVCTKVRYLPTHMSHGANI